MGMTIDEHISQLKKLRSFHNGSYGESINFAIDIMRKYEKIEQIITNYTIMRIESEDKNGDNTK